MPQHRNASGRLYFRYSINSDFCIRGCIYPWTSHVKHRKHSHNEGIWLWNQDEVRPLHIPVWLSCRRIKKILAFGKGWLIGEFRVFTSCAFCLEIVVYFRLSNISVRRVSLVGIYSCRFSQRSSKRICFANKVSAVVMYQNCINHGDIDRFVV